MRLLSHEFQGNLTPDERQESVRHAEQTSGRVKQHAERLWLEDT